MTAPIERAKKIYNIAEWSEGYFDINDKGHLIAQLPAKSSQPIDLYDLIADLRAKGLRLPLLIRFADILTDRITALCHAFQDAMANYGYEASFTSIYPIKVNQHRYLVETVMKHPGPVGLEAGSKSELLAVLGVAHAHDQLTIVCNGYKDEEYIHLALIGTALGHKVYIIIEKLSELETVLAQANALAVTPLLGVRVRLASIAKGRWQNTGGDKSKFGLTAHQLQTLVRILKENNQLNQLHCLHCHLGSQISNVRDIQKGVQECARFYIELSRLGAPLGVLDVGGGLGVDYEGTRSRNYCSMNYTWQEYANTIVMTLKMLCDENGIAPPHLMTESGRAVTAHHAMLVTNIIGVESPVDQCDDQQPVSGALFLQWMLTAKQKLSAKNAIEIFHDVMHWMGEMNQQFSHGAVSLAERAQAERLFYSMLHDIKQWLDPAVKYHQAVLDQINEKCASKFFCNLSIFQSLPDVWAIDQIFPILPLSHNDQPITERAVLQDLTCDSDGRVDHYVDSWGVESTLPLPEYSEAAPYCLAFFMAGAYQETLGDIHNLFGDTDSVHLELNADGQYEVIHQASGDQSQDVLSLVKFDVEKLMESYQQQLDRSSLSDENKKDYLEKLEQGLAGYTYFEDGL